MSAFVIPYRFGESRERHAQRVTEYVQQENAMDRPFYEMKAERAIARMEAKAGDGGRAARSAARAPAPGLVSNETSPPASVDKFQIDPHAKRIKRMRTGVQHTARLIDFDATAPGEPLMVRKFITLTYADVDGWEPKHIARFIDRLRKWCAKRNLRTRYVWVAELQERGAVHYHLVVWLPAWHRLPFFDNAGWWKHGSTNIKNAHSPIGYISKYASKATRDHAANYPKGARMHGAGGTNPEMRRELRYWQAPFFVRDALKFTADIRKVRGGYANKITGEFLPSPWAVSVLPDGRVFAYRKQETLQ